MPECRAAVGFLNSARHLSADVASPLARSSASEARDPGAGSPPGPARGSLDGAEHSGEIREDELALAGEIQSQAPQTPIRL